MRLLALRPKGLVLPSVHSFMVRAFRALGASVLETPVPQSPDIPKILRNWVQESRAEAVFVLDLGADWAFVPHVKEAQHELRVPWIVWFVDDPEGYGFPDLCDPAWTLAFCWDRLICEQRPRKERLEMRHLPLAAEPSVFFPDARPGSPSLPGGVFAGSTVHENLLLQSVADRTPELQDVADRIWRSYRLDFQRTLHGMVWDEAFGAGGGPCPTEDPLRKLWAHACLFLVGIRKRKEVVERVLGSDGRVYGDESWRRGATESIYGGRVDYGGPLRDVYNRSAFVLEVRQPQSRTGLSQRVFDGSACGRPLVAEFSPELEDLFDVDKEMFSFRNLEEASEARTHCLRDPREAQRRSKRAFRRILSHHTFQCRAAEMLQACQEFIA
jgi:hypothetical protein